LSPYKGKCLNVKRQTDERTDERIHTSIRVAYATQPYIKLWQDKSTLHSKANNMTIEYYN